jgi:hypothetical protein
LLQTRNFWRSTSNRRSSACMALTAVGGAVVRV